MQILDNVAVADQYNDAGAAIEFVLQSNGGYFAVVNFPVYMQLAYNIQGQVYWTREVPVPIGTGTLFPGTAGIRFRNYTAGNVGRVSAALSEKNEPSINLGSGGIASSSSSGGGVTADIVWSAATSRSGAVLCDGTLYDGTTATFLALWNAIGLTYGGGGQVSFAVPDLRGRSAVGLGTNASVNARGLNEGAILANRRPHHSHTNNAVAQGGAGNAGTNSAGNQTFATVGLGTAPIDTPAFLVLNAFILL